MFDGTFTPGKKVIYVLIYFFIKLGFLFWLSIFSGVFVNVFLNLCVNLVYNSGWPY